MRICDGSWRSGSCIGEVCRECGADAFHKVGEEIPHDDPQPDRHNWTAYLCCLCFMEVFGDWTHNETPETKDSIERLAAEGRRSQAKLRQRRPGWFEPIKPIEYPEEDFSMPDLNDIEVEMGTEVPNKPDHMDETEFWEG